MEKTCPQCHTKNPVLFKFCAECGHNLTSSPLPPPKAPSLDEKFQTIQRYLPQEITKKILEQKNRIEGERKQITIMFCDIKGFTSITEKFGPDKTFELIDEVFEILVHKVNDYQGIVNELRGDGILAFFGAPVALEDAPQRAIRSALAIHKEMNKFNNKNPDMSIPPVLLRIGISTGPVVVGTVGNDIRVQYTAMGDTINMAARMESLAEPGTTYVTYETFKLTEGFFRFEALGARYVKGKGQPMNVYRVIAPNSTRTRFDVRAERGLTPLSGREMELGRLFDGFRRVKEGTGLAFFVVSDAGMGKSRLLYEFRKGIANENITFIEGKCLSYSSRVPYHLIIDILKSVFNISEEDRDDAKTKKIEKLLGLLSISQTSTLHYLLELLSVKTDVKSMQLSSDARREKILEAIQQIIVKYSEYQPLILACEDLHWMDKSSEEALRYILNGIAGAEVLLIFTYRPEFLPSWSTQPYHNQLTLKRLSNRENLAMVSHLLHNKEIDSQIENLILEKTEGIPFFIEEFVQSLIELKIIELKGDNYRLTENLSKFSIPSTIHDVIMARVDPLPFAVKGILQIGSIIEREFSYDLMKLVAKIPEEQLLSCLSILKNEHLLYERSVFQQSIYIFNHALTREIVYDSILTKKKMLLHDEIGKAIEVLYIDRLDEYYCVLSQHYILSENFEKGAEFSRLAGKQAQKRSAYNDAISFAQKSVSCLEKLPPTEAAQKNIIDARTAISNYCMGLNHHYDAMQAVATIISLAQQIDYKIRLPQIYLTTGSYKIFVEEDFVNGIEDLTNAKNLSQEIDDSLAFWYAVFFLGATYYLEADFEKSLHHFQRALTQSKSTKSVSGQCFAYSSMAAWPYGHVGKLDIAYVTSKDALDLAIESGDIFIQQTAYSSLGTCCIFKGLLTEADIHLQKAIQLQAKAGNLFWGTWCRFWYGELCFFRGENEKAAYHYNQARITTEQKRVIPSWAILNQVKMLQCKATQNKKDIPVEALFECARLNKLRINDGIIANSIADILMNLAPQYFAVSEEWLNQAILINRKYGNNWRLAGDYALYALLCKKQNNQLMAKENLKKAITIYGECEASGWVEKYKFELASLC